MKQDKLNIGSDGSLKNNICMYGFVLDCGEDNNSAWGQGKCPSQLGTVRAAQINSATPKCRGEMEVK